MTRIVECDTRNQQDFYVTRYFSSINQGWIRNKLYCGDFKYVDSVRVIIDLKQSGGGLLELSGNLCHKEEHERVKREIEKARSIGCIRFVFLVVDDNITSIDEVYKWKVPTNRRGDKLSKVDPMTLQKIMITMQVKYGCEFIFTNKYNCGKDILTILDSIK